MKWAPLERIGEGLLVAVAATAITTSIHTCYQHQGFHAAQEAAAVERDRLQGESDEEVLRDVGDDALRDRLRAIERAAD